MGIEERIAEIQRKHREELHEEGVCICGWHARETDYPDHVASVLVAELGLSEETALRVDWPHQSVVLTDRDDIRAAHRFLDCELVDVSRHVTPWTSA